MYIAEQTYIAKHLGELGLKLYKTIFDNNNIGLIDKFFKDPLINKLWPKIVENMTY